VQRLSKKEEAELTAMLLADIKKFFGPPPVLSTESAKAFDDALVALIQEYWPVTYFEKMHIRDIVDDTWEKGRYKRNKALAIERRYRQDLEAQAERQKLAAENAKRTAILAQQRAEHERPASLVDRVCEVEDVLWEEAGDVDDILTRAPTVHDHALALERSIEYVVQLDKLQNNCAIRSHNSFQSFERAHRFRQQTELSRMLAGEYGPVEPQLQEVAASAIATPSEGGK